MNAQVHVQSDDTFALAFLQLVQALEVSESGGFRFLLGAPLLEARAVG